MELRITRYIIVHIHKSYLYKYDSIGCGVNAGYFLSKSGVRKENTVIIFD